MPAARASGRMKTAKVSDCPPDSYDTRHLCGIILTVVSSPTHRCCHAQADLLLICHHRCHLHPRPLFLTLLVSLILFALLNSHHFTLVQPWSGITIIIIKGALSPPLPSTVTKTITCALVTDHDRDCCSRSTWTDSSTCSVTCGDQTALTPSRPPRPFSSRHNRYPCSV